MLCGNVKYYHTVCCHDKPIGCLGIQFGSTTPLSMYKSECTEWDQALCKSGAPLCFLTVMHCSFDILSCGLLAAGSEIRAISALHALPVPSGAGSL